MTLEVEAPETTEDRSPAPRVFAQYVFFRVDPRARLDLGVHRESAIAEFVRAVPAPGVTTHAYTALGLKAGVDFGLWRIASEVEAFQEQSARLARTALGARLETTHSLLGMTQPSQYVHRRTPQDQSIDSTERSRYLVIYPFTKTADWYLLDQEVRATMMGGHVQVGRRHPQIRQTLLYSFGLDDQEFIVSYEMEDLGDFSRLVHELRATEARRYTLSDVPIFTLVHRELQDCLELVT
ncbi:MAG: chlorite dismutase family protein [Candidatus Dormibacteria bacterium]